jgi:hypothetical protein
VAEVVLVARVLAAGVVLAAPLTAPLGRADATDRCIADSELGQRLLLTRRFVEARPHLLACGAAACPAPIARDCAERARQADASIATVIVSATLRDGSGAPDARVRIDGAPVAQGEAVSLDPGPHRFQFERADEQIDETVVVDEGARMQRVVGAFAPPPPHRLARRRLAAELTGATGIAAVATSVVLGALARTDRDRERSECASAADCTDYAGAQRDFHAAHTDATASTICIAAGGALIAAGIAVWFASREHAIAVAPAPGGVALQGRF